jgi:hypothetical protein
LLNKRDAILNEMGYEGEHEKERTPLDKSRAPLPYVSKFRGCCYTPQKNEEGGMILAWDTKVTSPPPHHMTNTDKHLATRVKEGGRPKNWVLVASSWIILSDYQIASQSSRQEGHLTRSRVPSLGWCWRVLPSPLSIMKYTAPCVRHRICRLQRR